MIQHGSSLIWKTLVLKEVSCYIADLLVEIICRYIVIKIHSKLISRFCRSVHSITALPCLHLQNYNQNGDQSRVYSRSADTKIKGLNISGLSKGILATYSIYIIPMLTVLKEELLIEKARYTKNSKYPSK